MNDGWDGDVVQLVKCPWVRMREKEESVRRVV